MDVPNGETGFVTCSRMIADAEEGSPGECDRIELEFATRIHAGKKVLDTDTAKGLGGDAQ